MKACISARLFDPRFLAMVAFGAIASVAAVGFAAQNTVPATKAGDGTGSVSGYTVSSIHYTLDSNNPPNISAAQFTLSAVPPTGTTLKLQLVGPNGTWYGGTLNGGAGTCSSSGANITCPLSPTVPAASANQFRVIIVD